MKLEPDRGDPPENEIPATEKGVSPGHLKYGRISVIIALINLALSCLCLFLWAFSSPVTGGMGYIPFGLMDAIVALALVGVICGQMASKQKRNCLVLLGGLFNASILLVILAIRLA